MSKYDLHSLWEEFYGDRFEAYDYAGRRMLKSAIGNHNSQYEPTVDHIRPLSKGGRNQEGNIIICNRQTNFEKADTFPTWVANGTYFQARRSGYSYGSYFIYELDI